MFSIGEDSSLALLVSGESSQEDCCVNCAVLVSVEVMFLSLLPSFSVDFLDLVLELFLFFDQTPAVVQFVGWFVLV